MSASALILLAHGSSDPRWAEPFEEVARRVRAHAQGPVLLAYLERMRPDLATAAEEALRAGARSIVIVPLFLGQGGHVREDLPRLAADLRTRHAGLEVALRPPVGEAPGVLDAIAAYCREQASARTDSSIQPLRRI